MTAKFNHTPDTDAVIREGYEKGWTAAIIAGQLGTTRMSVIGRANRLGLVADRSLIRMGTRPAVVRDMSRADDEMHLDWLACYQNGWSAQQIADRWKVTRNLVYGVLNRIQVDDIETGDCPPNFWRYGREPDVARVTP